MNTAVLVGTFALAGLVVILYVWFVVVRYRAEKQGKRPITTWQPPPDATPTMPVLPDMSAEPAAPIPPAAHAPPPAAAPAPAPAPDQAGATVASALAGVQLPCDLAPLINIAPRPAVGDRVAFFTTDFPAETVGARFADELERLGFTLDTVDADQLLATKGDARLVVCVHPFPAGVVVGSEAAFPTAPDGSVVVETWVP